MTRTEASPGGTFPARPRGSGRLFAAFAPIVIATVFTIGFAWFIGWPKWPVADAGERIAYSALAACVAACVVSIVRCGWTRLALNLVAAALCVLPAMWPQYQNESWNGTQLALWATLVIGGVGLAASLTQRLRERDGQTPLASLVTLGMTLSTGGLLMSTGSLKLGQAGFALAAGVAIVFVIGVFVTPLTRSAGATTLAMAVLGGLLVSGYLWSELPWYAGLCVLVAPVLAYVSQVKIIARRPTWQRVVIGVVVAAIPATVVTTIAAIKAQHASEAVDEYGY